MITEITGEKGDGEHGAGWALELPWLLHVGIMPVLLPGVAALEVRFQQLLPQRGREGGERPVQPRVPGSTLPSYATCLSWDGASHSSSPRLRFPICDTQGLFAALRRIWESCRL